MESEFWEVRHRKKGNVLLVGSIPGVPKAIRINDLFSFLMLAIFWGPKRRMGNPTGAVGRRRRS